MTPQKQGKRCVSGWGSSSMVECLVGTHEALDWNLRPEKMKKYMLKN